MTKDEALRLALEALEINNKEWKDLADSGDSGFWDAEDQNHYQLTKKAITAIKEALETKEGLLDRKSYLLGLYDQKPWVGLKDNDEIPWDGVDAKSFAKAIEAKLKEKNE